MNFLCETKSLKNAVYYPDDLERVSEYLDGKHISLVMVTIAGAKTLSQLGAIWRDWQEAGKLLHMTKEQIYAEIMLSPEFEDLFLVKTHVLRTGKRQLRYRGLSEFDKHETGELISRYREWLQSWIDLEYGEPMPVEWSRDHLKEQAYLNKGE